jgi:hypothetical protein
MQQFDDAPLHDEHEHASSAFRYGAQAIEHGLVSNLMHISNDYERQRILEQRGVAGV